MATAVAGGGQEAVQVGPEGTADCEGWLPS